MPNGQALEGVLNRNLVGFLIHIIPSIRCSSDKVRLTHEQLRFVKHEMNPGDVIKIVAFAGR